MKENVTSRKRHVVGPQMKKGLSNINVQFIPPSTLINPPVASIDKKKRWAFE